MAENSRISWCDHTHNEWLGCQRLSPACDGCYAAVLVADRFGRVIWGEKGAGAGTRVLTSVANRQKPHTWDRKAAANGTRPFVFSLSLGDVFDNQVDPEWRAQLFTRARATPHLIWLFLTKRPQNAIKMTEAAGPWPPNAWLGATMEDRERVLTNAFALLEAGHRLRVPLLFASCEPLLEDIADLIGPWIGPPGSTGISWVLCGGETSQGHHRARFMDPAWARNLRDATRHQGGWFHLKQMTERGEIPADLQIRERPYVH